MDGQKRPMKQKIEPRNRHTLLQSLDLHADTAMWWHNSFFFFLNE